MESHKNHDIDAIRFPPICLAKVKETLIEATISTHEVGKDEVDHVKSRLHNNPIGYIIDGRPHMDNQLNMMTSHMVDIALQLANLPQLLGITLDDISMSVYSDVRRLVILSYTFIFNCLNNPKVKRYVCFGKVCTIHSVGKLYHSQDVYLRMVVEGDGGDWMAQLKSMKESPSATPWIQAMIGQLGFELGVGEGEEQRVAKGRAEKAPSS